MAPLVVGQVRERASRNNSGVANIITYSLIVSINWSFNLSDHKLGNIRIAVCNHVGYLNRVPLRERKEEVPIASISCVELIPIKINASES